MKEVALFLLATIALVGCTSPRTSAIAPSPEWQIVSVHDGDIIRVRRNNVELKIRFACIDAPELKQPLGEESRNYLRSLLPKGKSVGVKVVDVDRYGRSVAEVFADGQLVQAKQAEQGTVYVYQKYLHNCPDAKLVTDAEAIAKGKQIGVWAGDYQKPWDYI